MPAAVKPSHRRARSITTHEGRFIHVNDYKEAIRDPAFMAMCLKAGTNASIVGARKTGANPDPHIMIYAAMLTAVTSLSGGFDEGEMGRFES